MKVNGYDVNIDSLLEELQIDHDFYVTRNGFMLKEIGRASCRERV